MSVSLRKKKMADGRQSFYLDSYVDGKRRYEFLKIYTTPGALDNKEKIRQAEQVRAKRELEQSGSRHGIAVDHKRSVKFLEFARGYLAAYDKKDLRMVRYAIAKFEMYLDDRSISKTLRMDQVTPELCAGFRGFLMSPKSGLRGETPQNYFARFKRILMAAEADNLIMRNPTRGLSIRRTNELHKQVLGQEDIRLLAQAHCGNEAVKRAFLFSCFTGLGFAEIQEVTGQNVQGDRFTYVRKKTKQMVSLYLHPSARELLKLPDLKRNEPAFMLPSPPAVKKCIMHWIKRAGLEHDNITFYSARHSYATNLLRNGVNLKTVADCMGHTTVQHTVKYLNYVNDLKDDAVKGLMTI